MTRVALFVLHQQIFNSFFGQPRVFRREAPINVEASVTIHRDRSPLVVRSWDFDTASLEIDSRPVQVEVQIVSREGNAQMPEALLGERLFPARVGAGGGI